MEAPRSNQTDKAAGPSPGRSGSARMRESDFAALFVAVVGAISAFQGLLHNYWPLVLIGVIAALIALWVLIAYEHRAPNPPAESIAESPVKADNQKALDERIRTLQSELAGYRKEIGAWQAAAIDLVDSLDRILASSSLDQAGRTSVTEARGKLVGQMKSLGLEEIRPEVGDEFDDRLHSANGGQDSGPIESVVQTGFASGSRIMRPAKVTLKRQYNQG